MKQTSAGVIGQRKALMTSQSIVKLIALLVWALARSAFSANTLNGHTVVLDSKGKILSWVNPQGQAFARVTRLAWDFLLNSEPLGPNGLKAHLTDCCLDPKGLRLNSEWPHDPASTYAAFVDSAVAYYAYSGDRDVVTLVQQMLDYHLQHGLTPAKWDWARVPYASSDGGASEYVGGNDVVYCAQLGEKGACGTGDGHYVVEPDKVGELGMGFLRFYELTGEAKYRQEAIACADALVRHIRQGDFDHSPWPFRVYAENNKVREEYTSNVIGPVRLFDELVRLKLGNVNSYQKKRQMAWNWMMAYPMQNDRWIAYFEDVPIFSPARKRLNFNQYSPMETARYMLLHPQYDPAWRTHVAHLIQLVEKRFAVDVPDATAAYPFIPPEITRKMKAPPEPGIQWGADAISEQMEDMNKMGSHTSRYASINALWYAVTGDKNAKEKAFRSFNWATYMCRPNGVVNVGPVDNSVWFIDGYGDYIRHFMSGIGAVPEWAPPGEDHVVSSTSVVQNVSYRPRRISFSTFDGRSSELLRLSFVPVHVVANGIELTRRRELSRPGWTFDPQSMQLRVRHASEKQAQVVISGR